MKAIVTIHRPELTTEVRAKRMEEIKRAATRLVTETAKAKKRKTLKHF